MIATALRRAACLFLVFQAGGLFYQNIGVVLDPVLPAPGAAWWKVTLASATAMVFGYLAYTAEPQTDRQWEEN